MVYQGPWLPCVISKTHLHRKLILILMPPTRYPKSWSSQIARSEQARLNSSCGASIALSKACSIKRTLQRYCCSIYGTAKQVAVYGGLNLGLELNVLLFACIYDYIIKRMVLYRHSSREELSPRGGITEATADGQITQVKALLAAYCTFVGSISGGYWKLNMPRGSVTSYPHSQNTAAHLSRRGNLLMTIPLRG